MDASTIASLGIGGPFIALCVLAIARLYSDIKKITDRVTAALEESSTTLREFSRVATILLERRWDR
jgi:hypothetical protein